MKVYIDVIIFENFIVNTFLLMITMKMTSHKYKMKNLLLSGFIGSLYTLVMIIPELMILNNLFLKIAIACSMLRVTSGKINFLDFIRTLGVFFITTFSLSGICFLCTLNQNSYILGSEYKIKYFSIKDIILSVMVLCIICFRIYDYIKEKSFIKSYMYDVEMTIDQKKIKFKAFLDTGNCVKEPVTNLPCIIVEEKLLNNINIDKHKEYCILYSTVNESDNLTGIRVDDINLSTNGKLIKKVDAILCPCKKKFNDKNEFDALLPRGII